MDEETFEYIIEAMNEAYSLLEDINNQDYKRELIKLGIAIDKFYNWHNKEQQQN